MGYYRFFTSETGRKTLRKRPIQLGVKRLFDISIALLALLVLFPSKLFRRSTNSSHQIELQLESGRYLELPADKPYTEFYQYQRQPLHSQFTLIWQVLLGRLSWVGAAPVETSEESALYVSLGVKPGLFSTYSLKRQANLTLLDRDYELLFYLEQASLKTDLGIFLRSIVGRMFNQGEADRPDRLEMLGVGIDNMKIEPALEWIINSAKSRDTLSRLAFVNPDCLNISVKDSNYLRIVNDNDKVFADGIGVHLACGMLDIAMHDNLNGTDLFPRIAELAQAEGVSIYLLGGKPGTTAKMVEKIRETYPNLTIAGHRDGYFDATQNRDVVEEINTSQADILLVAMGVPKQEQWIDANRDSLEVGLAMGVGGLFDFVSGSMPRAPLWMREIGMEWAYRLYQEPGRMWRRYILGNPLFLYRIWRYKHSIKQVGICPNK